METKKLEKDTGVLVKSPFRTHPPGTPRGFPLKYAHKTETK